MLFHHGREMTANDVSYSLSRLMDLGLSACQGWMTEGIENIRVLNRSALAIELKQPNELFLQQLAHPSLAILPEEICRDNEGIFGRMPIGTGPFRLERNDDYICKLRAFDSYFGVRPHLDQLKYGCCRKSCRKSGLAGIWCKCCVTIRIPVNRSEPSEKTRSGIRSNSRFWDAHYLRLTKGK